MKTVVPDQMQRYALSGLGLIVCLLLSMFQVAIIYALKLPSFEY